jgi:hypothetical protein
VLNFVRVDTRLEARLGRVISEAATSRAQGGDSGLLVLAGESSPSCSAIIAIIVQVGIDGVEPPCRSSRAPLLRRVAAQSDAKLPQYRLLEAESLLRRLDE